MYVFESEAKKVVCGSSESASSYANVLVFGSQQTAKSSDKVAGTSPSGLEARFIALMENMDKRMQRLEMIVEKMITVVGCEKHVTGGSVSATTNGDKVSIGLQTEVFLFSKTVSKEKDASGGSVKSASSSHPPIAKSNDGGKLASGEGFVFTTDLPSGQAKKENSPNHGPPGTQKATVSRGKDAVVVEIHPSQNKKEKKKKTAVPSDREKKWENRFQHLSVSMDEEEEEWNEEEDCDMK